jgi:hypothetical protein
MCSPLALPKSGRAGEHLRDLSVVRTVCWSASVEEAAWIAECFDSWSRLVAGWPDDALCQPGCWRRSSTS